MYILLFHKQHLRRRYPGVNSAKILSAELCKRAICIPCIYYQSRAPTCAFMKKTIVSGMLLWSAKFSFVPKKRSEHKINHFKSFFFIPTRFYFRHNFMILRERKQSSMRWHFNHIHAWYMDFMTLYENSTEERFFSMCIIPAVYIHSQ